MAAISSKCDNFQNIINHGQGEEEVATAKVQKEVHLRKAQQAVDTKKQDAENSKKCDDTHVICFDLQQALPTPLIATFKVFYLRQLWTYNFCVHNITTGKSTMYVWDETTASRGSQEIGSCLIHFINNVLDKNILKLIAYSDSCGGQNKNKNIVKLFMFLVNATRLKQIHHKFLEPGHTFMECDRDFGIIEKVKRKIPQVFIPDHWVDVIRTSCKNSTVIKMTQKDFYSFQTLNDMISDPKKDTDNILLKWRPIQYFLYKKSSETFSFSFKETLNETFPFIKCVCPLKHVGRPILSMEKVFQKNLNLQPLKINKLKWDNLQTLLAYVPPVYHKFYNDIPYKQKNKNTSKKKVSDRPKNRTEDESSEVAGPSNEVDNIEETEVIDMLESDYE